MVKLLDFLRRKSARYPASYPLRIPGFAPTLCMEVHHDNDAHISKSIELNGIWEPAETQFIQRSVNKGHTFVDVGANIGYFTIVASDLVGDRGKVLAFEPDPENFVLLERNCQINGCTNTSNYPVALSNETVDGALYLSKVNKGDHQIYPSSEERHQIPIKMLKGSKLFEDLNLNIDFLKVDTQGAEYQVLQGLLPTVKNSLPQLIIMVEFSPNSMIDTGANGGMFLQLFESLEGYFYLLDGEDGELIPISREELGTWVNITQMDANIEGFINLIFSGTPLEKRKEHTVRKYLDFYETALQFLLASGLPPWDGHNCSSHSMNQCLYFSKGWSFIEEWGVWSDGNESKIKFFLSESLTKIERPVLGIKGRYFGSVEKTEVYLNEKNLGEFSLENLELVLPGELLQGVHATIKLVHKEPLRPCDIDGGNDDRLLKFGLESIEISSSTTI